MQWRREATVATRKIGYDNIPKFMCGEDDRLRHAPQRDPLPLAARLVSVP